MVFLDKEDSALAQCLQWEGKVWCRGRRPAVLGGESIVALSPAIRAACFFDRCLQSVGTTHRCTVCSPGETCCRRVQFAVGGLSGAACCCRVCVGAEWPFVMDVRWW